MKIQLSLSLAALILLPLGASAGAGDYTSGTVACTGQKGSMAVNITITASPSAKGADFSYIDKAQPNSAWSFTADPRDIGQTTIDFLSVNFLFGHHNTVIKVLADGDIFGGAGPSATEQSPYKGILFMEDGDADHPNKKTFAVTCVKTN